VSSDDRRINAIVFAVLPLVAAHEKDRGLAVILNARHIGSRRAFYDERVYQAGVVKPFVFM